MQYRSGPLARLVAGYLCLIRGLAGLSMAAIVAIMLAQVFWRYVLGGSLIWAEELCRYLLIWQTFLVLGLAFSKGEFVSLDFVPSLLSARLRWGLRAVMAVPILAFLAVMAWYGWDFAERMGPQTIPALDFIWSAVTGEALGLSIRWVYISVSVGMVLLAGHILTGLVVDFHRQVILNLGEEDAALAQTSEMT
ncbi:TRAP transporter small permease [Rhodovulum sulfidophilum]|uniref:TRAP transporter small permease n=1 Tax=Rhodovulum sulfidophilum TaxID=35806 RepID=UPI0019264E68|nr:TRAP transporter small permease [Rhodovulum sulfidophilum]MBL3586797.1 TRAP transporter small permease [Rhodovulum sulfidophilum]